LERPHAVATTPAIRRAKPDRICGRLLPSFNNLAYAVSPAARRSYLLRRPQPRAGIGSG
jgi:hypothetical protein